TATAAHPDQPNPRRGRAAARAARSPADAAASGWVQLVGGLEQGGGELPRLRRREVDLATVERGHLHHRPHRLRRVVRRAAALGYRVPPCGAHPHTDRPVAVSGDRAGASPMPGGDLRLVEILIHHAPARVRLERPGRGVVSVHTESSSLLLASGVGFRSACGGWWPASVGGAASVSVAALGVGAAGGRAGAWW